MHSSTPRTTITAAGYEIHEGRIILNPNDQKRSLPVRLRCGCEVTLVAASRYQMDKPGPGAKPSATSALRAAICSSCQTERDARDAAIAKQSAAEGLPELKAVSAKQKAFAARVRRDVLNRRSRLRDREARRKQERRTFSLEQIDAAIAEVSTYTDAKWWLDRARLADNEELVNSPQHLR